MERQPRGTSANAQAHVERVYVASAASHAKLSAYNPLVRRFGILRWLFGVRGRRGLPPANGEGQLRDSYPKSRRGVVGCLAHVLQAALARAVFSWGDKPG